jgi:hypothetical protein
MEYNKMLKSEKLQDRNYEYRIDLDERGYYYAHVEDSTGKIVFSLNNEVEEIDGETGESYQTYGGLQLVEDGFMKHNEDMAGLENYLVEMKVIPQFSNIKFMG